MNGGTAVVEKNNIYREMLDETFQGEARILQMEANHFNAYLLFRVLSLVDICETLWCEEPGVILYSPKLIALWEDMGRFREFA